MIFHLAGSRVVKFAAQGFAGGRASRAAGRRGKGEIAAAQTYLANLV